MNLYGYSLSGLIKPKWGKIRAKSPIEAARKLLKSPLFCRGNRYSLPYIYMEDDKQIELKLWIKDEDLGPSQWEMDL